MRRKTLWKGLLISLLLLVLFRGVLYRAFIQYQIVGTREFSEITDEALAKDIRRRTAGKELNTKEILEVSRRLTDRSLTFTTGESSNETNAVYRAGAANCIGYAALYAATVSFIAEDQGVPLLARQVVGKLELLGWDLHAVFGNHPFFRDHDFVEIRGAQSDEYYYVDPTVSDYLGIRFVRH
ncbi:cupredoxin domain-containing protein [Flavilitoribacter nigricans]|uniref:Transglutaminase-like domain-containing protein n=1 Tax=Flavilitoribacter nigricans (strain ATCC 23147 / DSM 23189 / NBRC 102662 / NCIMB 1420 / SS-2) TaxID=1122177 RepID=A0A2D0N468_FLAN2|nr:hypothetical protein [Flavilitoribacter nigricans]PHN03190.1 hypothetical protein CRP01_27740 [Flavilitoribacter nigricans DSM 23189 = NBRC 102662]